MEKEMLGIYISGHPLEKIKEKIQKVATINTLQMMKIAEEGSLKDDGKEVKYVGIITSIKKKKKSRKKRKNKNHCKNKMKKKKKLRKKRKRL